MNGGYRVLDLANEVILIANENNLYITNLQLQKVMYYIQGEFMKIFGHKAFNEKIECWPYGPVIRQVWRSYNSFGRSPLIARCSKLCLKDREKQCIENIIKEKLNMNVWDLVDQTHIELPWENARKQKNPYLSDSDMEEFFCKKNT